jgi:hypothetical protein
MYKYKWIFRKNMLENYYFSLLYRLSCSINANCSNWKTFTLSYTPNISHLCVIKAFFQAFGICFDSEVSFNSIKLLFCSFIFSSYVVTILFLKCTFFSECLYIRSKWFPWILWRCLVKNLKHESSVEI